MGMLGEFDEEERATVDPNSRTRVYVAGWLLIGARNAEEAAVTYRTWTGEEKFPEPEVVDERRLFPALRCTVAEALAARLNLGEEPPLWIGTVDDLGEEETGRRPEETAAPTAR